MCLILAEVIYTSGLHQHEPIMHIRVVIAASNHSRMMDAFEAKKTGQKSAGTSALIGNKGRKVRKQAARGDARTRIFGVDPGAADRPPFSRLRLGRNVRSRAAESRPFMHNRCAGVRGAADASLRVGAGHAQ